MKLLYILLLSGVLYAQIHKLDDQVSDKPEPASFFPHHLGDIWEYNTSDGLRRYTITKDSFLEDSAGYYLYYNNKSTPDYLIDTSLRVIEWPNDLDWYAYNLTADSGSYWTVYKYEYTNVGAYVKSINEIVVFGDTTVGMEIEYYEYELGIDDSLFWQHSQWMYTQILASGYGFIWEIREGANWPEPVLTGCVIDGDTSGYLSALPFKTIEDILPDRPRLYSNYPNPFNNITRIRFLLPRQSYVQLAVFDMTGALVKTVCRGTLSAGLHSIPFDAGGLSSSIYVYRLLTKWGTLSKRMILIK